MMKPKLVIFDFDGTLADTLTWFISVSDGYRIAIGYLEVV